MRELVRFVVGACVFVFYTVAIGAAFGVVLLTVNGAGWAASEAFGAVFSALR